MSSNQTMTPADITKMVSDGNAVLIDVRDTSELRQTGIADGAVHIPLMLINTKANPQHPEFDTQLILSNPVFVYCASGARSGMAAQALSQFGFNSVMNLGGLANWVQAGGNRIPFAI